MKRSSKNALNAAFNPLDIANLAKEENLYLAQLMKNNVREIVGSYHHKFDHLYECLQNSVDACERTYYIIDTTEAGNSYEPKIRVNIDLQSNKVTVIDNGLGMTKNEVKRYFFTPFATLKQGEQKNDKILQRGEKGVGSTFLSYGSNYIHITTKSMESNEITSGVLINALKWCNSEEDLLPMPEVEPYEPDEHIIKMNHGTIITIEFSEDTNLSNLSDYGNSVEHWEYILRLYTALGYIDFSENKYLSNLSISVKLIDKGETNEMTISKGYLFPHLVTESQIRLSALSRSKGKFPESQRDMDIVWDHFAFDQVSELISSRMEKARYLRHKKREMISFILNKYRPEAYVALTYSADYWKESNNKLWGEDFDGYLSHGIVFSTKCQKIGEQKRIEFAFRTGDFNRFFILLNMKNLKGDVGRKSILNDIYVFANFFANAIQNLFIENDDCLRPSPGPFNESQEADLEEMMEAAASRSDIPIKKMAIIKEPNEEQDVIALFFYLLGKGIIRGYHIYTTHISRTYDGIGKFMLDKLDNNIYNKDNNIIGVSADKFKSNNIRSPKYCFIEFKYSSDGLVIDVRSGYKRLQDIKWLICWEIGKRHKTEGIDILDITKPEHINKRDYHGITHLMTEGQNKVFIICLKKIIDVYRNGKCK